MNKIFDAHCDTIYELNNKNMGLLKNSIHLDAERMGKYDTYIQVFAAFVDKEEITVSPMNHCLKLMDKYHTELEKSGGMLTAIETAQQLEDAAKRGGAYSILSIEGAEALDGNLSALRMYYKMGVRLITLTWNYANELCDGITESRGGGLTDFGRKAVAMMEDMGILIDVSHLSERGFWDVAECTKYPFTASHSCAKALCGNERNLTDEQIKTIAERNGCIGVNFYPEFLSEQKKCDISDIVRHIKYMIDLGAEDAIGLGSDFDGVECLPQGINGAENMKNIISALNDAGFSQTVTDKIAFGNFYRLFYETLSRGQIYNNFC